MEYNSLTGSNYSLNLGIENIKEFSDYDMDEIYEGLITKNLILNNECLIEFTKKQLAK
jgi:hypothetical protein